MPESTPIAPPFPTAGELTKALGELSRGEPHKPFYGESEEILSLEQETAEYFGTETVIALNAGMAAVDAAVRIVCLEKIKQFKEIGLPMSEWGTFHFIVGEHLYYHSQVVFEKMAELYRIEVTVVDPTDLEQVKNAKRDNTIGIFFETTSNSFGMGIVPQMGRFEDTLGPEVKIIADISLSPTRKVSEEMKNKNNLILILSGTKDPSKGEVMAGFLCGGAYLNSYREIVRAAGQNLTPEKPIRLLREGLGTMDERVVRASNNAQVFAEKLEEYAQKYRKIIKSVSYPGLESHPQHNLVKEVLGGNAGGVLFVDFGSEELAAAFVTLVAKASDKASEQKIDLGQTDLGHKVVIATSLGTPETRMFPQAAVLPSEMGGVVRIAAGSEPLNWTPEMDEFFKKMGRVLEKAELRHLKFLARRYKYAKTKTV